MEHQQRQRNPAREEQLDVRQVRHHVRAERVDDRAGRRGTPIAGQVAEQQIRADEARSERGEQHDVQREPGVARGPVDRDAERARQQVGLGIRQRRLVRIEDVGVEEVQGIGDERARDPRDVPDAELAVGVGAGACGPGARGPWRAATSSGSRAPRRPAETRRARAGARWCRAGPPCRIARHCSAGHVITSRRAAGRRSGPHWPLTCRSARSPSPAPRRRSGPVGARLGVLPLDAPHVALAAPGRPGGARDRPAARSRRAGRDRGLPAGRSLFLPWLPFPVPAAFLIWTGALASLVWIAVAIALWSRVAARGWHLTLVGRAAARASAGRARGRHVLAGRVSRVAVDSRRRRAALSRHHAEPALRRRSEDREQPQARRLPRLLRRRSGAARHPAADGTARCTRSTRPACPR